MCGLIWRRAVQAPRTTGWLIDDFDAMLLSSLEKLLFYWYLLMAFIYLLHIAMLFQSYLLYIFTKLWVLRLPKAS